MSKTIYYTATSLDGFIADDQNSLGWLFTQEQDQAGPLNYDEFFAGVGAMAMGSTTYEWVREHEGEWLPPLPLWVMTTRDLAVPADNVQLASGDVRDVHASMTAAANGGDLWIVGGGDLVGQFADAGLLDELILYLAPITLGSGAPLLPRKLDLRLDELAQNKAFACARYSVLGPAKYANADSNRGG